ncbi:MAG: V-type ATP synthase subunit B [Nitrososphaeria archaeon]|nr:V-type ATP synthase subunit B [Nitrososphaeria archaeon]NIQ32993.1 V-type ATP synthase subunit B [Nitrososphaeria archaeon]
MTYRYSVELSTVREIKGPLLFIEKARNARYEEIVEIRNPQGEVRRGRVLDVSREMAIVQVFEGTEGLDIGGTTVRFLGEPLRFPVTDELMGMILDGSGRPLHGGLLVGEKRDVHGTSLNPYARAYPTDIIQTGISAIDGMNTLSRGQKLPLFSGSGLPHNRLAAQIARQAKVLRSGEDFVVVFVAMGITADEARFFRKQFEESGIFRHAVMFLNLADSPAIERLLTPRLGLTTAEYFAFDLGMHVLVILIDMTNYAEALREISAAREEVPARRGYPGYMYTDLASIYERAGRTHEKTGSVTQMPILTMPHDDITHPIVDLTGYITEGQIVMSRSLHQRGIYPPIDVLPSLSRLMKEAIGPGKTREDHRGLSDQLYYAYAEGRSLRELVAVIGEEALMPRDKQYLESADLFERRFISQGFYEERSVFDTLDLGWELISMFPEAELKRIDVEVIKKYYKGGQGGEAE